jgi:hypothetical protein
MSKLKALNFIPAPKTILDPVVRRRAKLMERLRLQIELFANPELKITEQRWQQTPDGTKQLLPRHKRIKRWWRTDYLGHTTLVVRYGAKPIEFAPGKTAIAVGDKNRVPEVLNAVLAATAAGELDVLFPASSTLRGAGKRVAAAKKS